MTATNIDQSWLHMFFLPKWKSFNLNLHDTLYIIIRMFIYWTELQVFLSGAYCFDFVTFYCICPLHICVCVFLACIIFPIVYLHFCLTTATQPRAGMLSLMAERWLKKLLPRFRSRKLWISWMWSEMGFSRSWRSVCTRATRRTQLTSDCRKTKRCRRKGWERLEGGKREKNLIRWILLHVSRYFDFTTSARS